MKTKIKNRVIIRKVVNNMKTLQQFIDENSNYVQLEDGDSVELLYKGFKVIPNKFDIDKETIEYSFADVEDREKLWTNGSNKVAATMAKTEPGAIVKITRAGEGNKTQYSIKTIDGFTPVAKQAKEEITAEDIAELDGKVD